MGQNENIGQLFSKTLEQGDLKSLTNLFNKNASFAFLTGNYPPSNPLPEESLNEFQQILESPVFHAHAHSHKVIWFLMSEWRGLTNQQRAALAPKFETAYLRVVDWMSHFLIAEIFGEYYQDDASLKSLFLFSKSPIFAQRSFAAYGLGFKLANSPDAATTSQIARLLREMTTDTAESVRSEAARALSKVPDRRARKS